jgi:hypothetical protein
MEVSRKHMELRHTKELANLAERSVSLMLQQSDASKAVEDANDAFEALNDIPQNVVRVEGHEAEIGESSSEPSNVSN